jgi:hypothetical protein
MADLRYRDVERALVKIFSVPNKRLGAFRARIRHLRNLGVPELERVGRGTQLTYTRQHALELVLAIELERVGIAPRFVASVAKQAALASINTPRRNVYVIIESFYNEDEAQETPRFLLKKHGTTEGIAYLSHGSYSVATIVRGTKNIRDKLRQWIRTGRLLFVLNVSACNSALPAEWK